MTDTTTIQPINAGSDVTSEDKIGALTQLVETLAKGQKALTEGLNKFSISVIETLSGMPANAPAPAPAATAPDASSAPAKRRGRPVGSRNKPKADAAPVAPEKPRELTADEKYAVDLVKRAGRITQTDLADALKIERSLVQSRMREPMRRRMVIAEIIEPINGGHAYRLYRRADWVSIKGE